MAAERATVEQRAAPLVSRIERVAKATWAVPSQTAPTFHVVAVVDGAWHCDCPGYEWRRQCSHIEAARLWVQQAQARHPRRQVALT
jgi:hypothetical protein